VLIKKTFTFFYFFLSFNLFSLTEGYYFNDETNRFFKFEGNNCFFSKFQENEKLSPLLYDVTNDKILISKNGENILTLTAIDKNSLKCDNILYSGIFDLLSNERRFYLEYDLTSDNDGKLKLLNESIQNFTESTDTNLMAEILFKRGKLFLDQKEYALALTDFNKSLELDPKYEDAIINSAICEIYLNDTSKSLKTLNTFIGNNPDLNNETTYFLKGSLNFLAGKNSDAIDSLLKSIEISKDFKEAYLLLGFVYLNIEDFNKAKISFDSLINLDNKNENYFLYRGITNFFLADNDNALNDLNHSIELNREMIISHILRTFVCFRNNIKDYYNYLSESKSSLQKIENVWNKITYDYFFGNMDLSTYLNKIHDKESIYLIKRSLGYFVIGLKLYINGNKRDAETGFSIVTDDENKLDISYHLSKYLLTGSLNQRKY